MEDITRVIITSHRPLTFMLIEELKLSKKNLDDAGIIDYEDDEHLFDSDYVYITFLLKGKIYSMVHGFPGDNPMGIVYRKNEYYIVGEGRPLIDNQPHSIIDEWYEEVTEELTGYKDDMWYARTKELKEPKSMEVSPPWAGFIFNGMKKKEVRKGGGQWKDVKEGDCLLINEKGNGEKYLFRVASVAKYSSLEDCLMKETVSKLLPGKATLQEGIDVYLGFDNPEGVEERRSDFAKYGAIAIELKRG